MDQGNKEDDESVEYLLEKLRKKGKKIKLLGEDEEENELDRDNLE